MASGEVLHDPPAMQPFGEAREGVFEAVLDGGYTLLGRLWWSKPAARIGAFDHEESHLARYN
jgi:hypothetical protein